MNEIIAFISPNMDEALRQKTAELLHIRHIKMTEAQENATLVICKTSDVPGYAMTLQEMAEIIISDAAYKIQKLHNQICVIPERFDFPEIPPTRAEKAACPTQRVKMPTYKQYNAVKQRFFNRTKCK